MYSVWSETVNFPAFGQQNENINTDALIIGGGITGLLCAYMLQQSGINYVLIEANTICGGITKNTTAKITSQHGLIYNELARKFGLEKARMYLEANETALKKYRELCEKWDCEFESKDSFVYCLDNRDKLEQELSILDKIGYPAGFVSTLPLPFSVAGAINFKNQAQFHPLLFLSKIAENLHILEHTSALEFIGNTVVTNHGKITAPNIIVTTHFPFLNKYGSYFLKMYQHRSYVLALENAPTVGGMYVDEAQKGLSFRNYKELLLIGGGDHRTGKYGGNWEELKKIAKKYYPDATEKYRWATQDCMTLDGVPYIGQYSKNTPGLYVATGFNKWGMTSSMAAAMLLNDMILGKVNPYAPVFSPSRSILHSQLVINTFEATTNLLTPTTKRCPHMGCALKWNPQEHSWDCPCHGSRFSKEGKLIDNPATDDLKEYKE